MTKISFLATALLITVPLAQQYRSSTVADFLGCHYQSPVLRRLAAAVIFIAGTVYLVAVYKGSALALQGFLGLDYRVAIVAVFLVVTSYTLAGGFRAVVLTDAVQGLLMAVGAVVMLVAVLYQGGGLPAVLEELRYFSAELAGGLYFDRSTQSLEELLAEVRAARLNRKQHG